MLERARVTTGPRLTLPRVVDAIEDGTDGAARQTVAPTFLIYTMLVVYAIRVQVQNDRRIPPPSLAVVSELSAEQVSGLQFHRHFFMATRRWQHA
jgi:hypothetical protein